MKLGVIGCGPMARHHAEVATAEGHSIAVVCSTGASTRRDAFVRDFGVDRTSTRVDDLISESGLKAVIVATPWDRTADVAEQVLASEIPSLIEKPLALSSARIRRWLEPPAPLGARTLVGYNRRFYDFLPDVAMALSTHELISVELNIPAPLDADIATASDWTPVAGLLYRASHALDLLLYLVGDVEVERIHRHGPGGAATAYNGLLAVRDTGVPVHLQINVDAPSRLRLAFNFTDRIYELSPLETLTVYEGLDVSKPTRERPIREYTPRVASTRHVDMTLKPGLAGQFEEFVATCVDGRRPVGAGCTLADAERVTRLCEAIAG